MRKLIYFIIILFIIFVLFRNSIIGAVINTYKFEGNISRFEQSNYNFWISLYTLKNKIIQQVKDGISYRKKNPLIQKTELDQKFDEAINTKKVKNLFRIPSDEKINEIFN